MTLLDDFLNRHPEYDEYVKTDQSGGKHIIVGDYELGIKPIDGPDYFEAHFFEPDRGYEERDEIRPELPKYKESSLQTQIRKAFDGCLPWKKGKE